MLRTKNPNPTDGGAFGPSARPPLEALTKDFARLFAELDELNGKIGHTSSDLTNLITNWGTHVQAARVADGRATAESGRTGTGVVVTDAAQALTAKKKLLEDQIGAYREALPLVLNDLAAERTKMQANLTPFRKTEDKARTRMHKALEEIDAAARELTSAVAVREWITDHLPWEGEALLDVATIWTPAHRIASSAEQAIPVHVKTVINALKGL